jgi:hypothetical protein
LKRIVLEQKIAPMIFEFIGGRLVLINPPQHTYPDDEKNIADATDKLLSQGTRVIDELKKSNCDRRLRMR